MKYSKDQGTWGFLSDGTKVPLDIEAVRLVVKNGIDYETATRMFGGLPGKWYSCRDGVMLPFDHTAKNVAIGLGWDHLLPKNDSRLFFP